MKDTEHKLTRQNKITRESIKKKEIIDCVVLVNSRCDFPHNFVPDVHIPLQIETLVSVFIFYAFVVGKMNNQHSVSHYLFKLPSVKIEISYTTRSNNLLGKLMFTAEFEGAT